MSEKKVDEFPSESIQSPVPIICENFESSGSYKSDIMGMLGEMEDHVEKIRTSALQIEEERDAMFSTLHLLKNSHVLEDLPEFDRDDIDRYVDRIYARCSTIDLCVRTDRDQPQEESLDKINRIIDGLIMQLHQDPDASKAKCLSFLNSCASHSDGDVEVNFDQALLGCAVDDQKRVRRRLQGLMAYIEKLSF